MFSYFGIRRIRSVLAVGVGVAACTVVLVSAVTGGSSHAAVWMGVSSDDAHNWLQAGIERTGATRPAEYIEVGRNGRQVSLRVWPTQFGHHARIRLLRRGDRWRIRIDDHVSHWIRLPHAHLNKLALLETYRQGGVVHGVAVINGKQVRG